MTEVLCPECGDDNVRVCETFYAFHYVDGVEGNKLKVHHYEFRGDDGVCDYDLNCLNCGHDWPIPEDWEVEFDH